MADGGMTITGLAELKAAANSLPARVLAASRGVASATAQRILAKARANLLSRTKGHGNTAAALKITDDSANQRFIVEFGVIADRPEMLPVWLEYGTRKRKALRFMFDASNSERARYQHEMIKAVEAVVAQALK